MKDDVTLRRVRSLDVFPARKGRKTREDDDYPVYERQEDGTLKPIFFQLNDEAERIYIDHRPEDHNPFDMVKSARKYDEWYEKHDNEYTEYEDYDYAKHFFKDNKFYVEVK
jgi:hypothetical protein